MAVYRRRNGDWYIDYYFKGRRLREKIGPSRSLALTVLRKRKVEIAEKRFLNKDDFGEIKFESFADTYLENHAKVNKRSWNKSDAVYLKHLKVFFRGRRLHEITPFLIEEYKKERIQSVSPASVNRELACLSVMFSKAIDWGKAKENPVRKIQHLKENNHRLRFLSQAEIRALLDNCSLRLKPIVVVAIHTGMRKGEIQNLKWRDIDFNNNIITILESKSGKKRDILMDSAVRNALNGVQKNPRSEYVFCDKEGFSYDFRKSFENALKKAKIESVVFHTLRHTFASHLAMAGVDLNTIRELLGHSNINVTLRYAHLSKNHRNDAILLLERKIDTPAVTNENSENLSKSDTIGTQVELVG